MPGKWTWLYLIFQQSMQELCFRRLIDLLADKLAGEYGDKGKPLTPEQIVLSG